jgi:hypothetical protein
MRPRTEQTRLLIAVLASVVAHALGIVVFAGSYGTLLARKVHAITTGDDPREIRLGIERSEAQTIDWIGYEEHRKHLVAQAEQSQALFRLGGAPASAPSPEQAPAPEQTERAFAERTIAEVLFGQLFEQLDSADFFAALDPSAGPEPGASPAEPAQRTAPERAPSEASEDSPTEQERPGNADKEADAVSRESVTHVKDYVIGQPLAVEGLDIKTVRPEWSVRTTLLARPRNPRVKIHFNRAGRVKLAVLEVSTGEPDVDRPLLDALYKWRATGAPLEKLAGDDPGATIAITLTIRLR